MHRIFGVAAVLILAAVNTSDRCTRSDQNDFPPASRDQLRQAYVLFSSGKHAEARSLYQQIQIQAQRNSHSQLAELALLGEGAAELAQFHYRNALRIFYQARDSATRHGNCTRTATAEGNIASVYREMGDLEGAVAHARRCVELRSCMPHALNRAQALMQMGAIYFNRGESAQAVRYSRMALEEIDSVDTAPKPAGATSQAANFEQQFVQWVLATNLEYLGTELSGQNPDAAEDALSRALRIRLLNKDPKASLSRYSLAKLKFSTGDLNSARHLIDAAIGANQPSSVPAHLFFDLRGRIRRAAGDLDGAVGDFRLALQMVAHWRSQIAPADTFRRSTDTSLQHLYDNFIETALQASALGGDPQLAVEAWRAAETNRAASLRESLLGSSGLNEKLHPEYWEILAQLRVIEGRSLMRAADSKLSKINALRSRLTELEARAGFADSTNFDKIFENNPARISLNSVQRGLGISRTLMSFHLGDQESYRWTVTGGSIHVAKLPSAARLTNQVSAFRDALTAGKPEAPRLGYELYQTLFSGDPEPAPRELVLAIEGPLHDLPFAALVTGFTPTGPKYLIEQSTLEIVPGAWAAGPRQTVAEGPFLGIGDAVYNTADSRNQAGWTDPFLRIGWTRSAPEPWVELPRLIGSATEVRNSASHWTGSARLLTGRDVTRARLVEALADKPAVVHIAAHFVPSKRSDHQTLIALSMHPDRSVFELLTVSDVSALRLPGSLVVLSGCSSGSGLNVRGAGLLGLTRAFLTAGATGVIASHWPTPDDTGEMFVSFYGHFRQPQTASPAGALRAAQLDMLHSSGWRSDPRYWAAFQLTARSNSSYESLR